MQAGKLRHQVTIQQLVTSQNSTTGVITNSWTTFATAWAAIEPLSVRDVLAAQTNNSDTRARATIRYLAGIKSSMRLVHGSDTYEIDGDPLADPKSGLEYLTLMLKRVANG